jgi:predicted RNase H-like nuclease (RuvC/YqgF family)
LAQLIAPICDAQFNLYAKIKRGQPCPYDSCVATELKQWRRESIFITTLRSENESLRSEIKSINSELSIADSTVETYKSELHITERAIVRKDSINKTISKNIAEIHRIASDALEPKKWYETNTFWFGVSVVLSLISSLR